MRGLGRERTVEDQRAAMVRVTDGVPLMVGDVSTVREGTEPQRGTASHDTRPAVIVCVQKQPGANTLEPMTAVEGVLAEIEGTLPRGVVIEKENFRHSDLIRAAIHNISVAMRDGAFLVVLILIVFLGNLRTTLISSIALPLSLVAGVLVVTACGGTIHTMALGGLTIAIGALVDDAIIVVENAFRMLREERRKPDEERRSTVQVVYGADLAGTVEAAQRAAARAVMLPSGYRITYGGAVRGGRAEHRGARRPRARQRDPESDRPGDPRGVDHLDVAQHDHRDRALHTPDRAGRGAPRAGRGGRGVVSEERAGSGG